MPGEDCQGMLLYEEPDSAPMIYSAPRFISGPHQRLRGVIALRNLLHIFLLMIVLFSCVCSGGSVSALPQVDYSGRYVFKDYRKGKGGYENHLEVSQTGNGRFHLTFELTYFYMAGKNETFHEGSGEGDGQLRGNVMNATLSDGAGGSCRVTLNFSETTISVQSSKCEINVVPDGLYKKELSTKTANQVSRSPVPRTLFQPEVCPDPKAPCNATTKKFAPYELSFRLPAKLTRGRTYQSLPFYAVLLKTYAEESCDADDHTASIERERVRIQVGYPLNKVFAAYSCPNLDAVDYDFAGKLDATGDRVLIQTFIAVYAGKTEAEGNQFLTYVRTIYPRAILKRMVASYEILDQ